MSGAIPLFIYALMAYTGTSVSLPFIYSKHNFTMLLPWHSCRIISKPEVVSNRCKHTCVSGMTVNMVVATYRQTHTHTQLHCCSPVCSTLLHVWELPSSCLGPQTGYTDDGLQTSASPARRMVGYYMLASSFHTCSDSLFIFLVRSSSTLWSRGFIIHLTL
jgi:hypothetical protein